MSLASSSSYSHLILALAAVSSSWGVKTAIISPLEVFDGPAAALPATVFLGIVLVKLYNFRVIPLGGLVYTYPIGPILNFCSLGFYSGSTGF